MSKITKILIVLLILASMYLICVSVPYILQDSSMLHNTWMYVDPETGINYIVVDGDTITPRMKPNGEYYITR